MNVSEAGTNVARTVRTTPYNTRPMGVTAYGSSVYWGTYDPGELWSAPADGSSATRLLDRGGSSYTRHIEFVNDKMYWNEEGNGSLYRSNPDGSAVEKLFTTSTTNASGIWDITIHNDRAYWTSWTSSLVKSSKLDGSDQRSFTLPGARRLFSIDSDDSGLIVGDNDSSTKALWHVNFDGSAPLKLLTTPSPVQSVSIYDHRAYFAYITGSGGPKSNVGSVALDGTDPRTDMVLENTVQIWQIDVVPAPATLAAIGVSGVMFTRRRRMR